MHGPHVIKITQEAKSEFFLFLQLSRFQLAWQSALIRQNSSHTDLTEQ